MALELAAKRPEARESQPPLPRSLIATWACGAFGVAVLMNGISALALFYLVLGTALSLAGFDPDQPPADVTPQVRQAVLLGIAYIPAAISIVAIAILSFYRLDEQSLTDARRDSAFEH